MKVFLLIDKAGFLSNKYMMKNNVKGLQFMVSRGDNKKYILMAVFSTRWLILSLLLTVLKHLRREGLEDIMTEKM